MNIAQVANILESVPPSTYGGTEFVVSTITEGLVRRGHSVCLFATGDSKTEGALSATYPTPVGYSFEPMFLETLHVQHLMNIFRQSKRFDIIHSHFYETLGLLPHLDAPMVFTLHTNLARKGEQQLLTIPETQKVFFVSISDAQRAPLPDLPYIKTIYHGVDAALFPFNDTPEDYLLFLGRINPDKGPEIAVEVARRCNKKLIVAAKVDDPDSDYAKGILKLFDDEPLVEFLGQVNDSQKKELYKNALAFLMPIQWEEPFGLVVIEALACGTPVVAMNRGSMPEIIRDKETGFLVTDVDEMTAAVNKITDIKRGACRHSIEEKFTIDRMVSEYEAVYAEILSK